MNKHACTLIAVVASGCVAGPESSSEDPFAAQTGAAQIVTVSASGAETGNGPTNAVDGSLATRWSCEGVGSWLEADLESAQSVTSVQVAWYLGNQRTNKFAIELSTDGSKFTRVDAGTSGGKTTSLETYTFASAQARYVRVVFDGNTQNDWASITELKIIGATVAAGSRQRQRQRRWRRLELHTRQSSASR